MRYNHTSELKPIQSSQTAIEIRTVSFPEPTFDPSIANCDFESGLCHYTQDTNGGSEAWKRVSVKPNLFRNGDHTTGAGGYIKNMDPATST